MNEWTTVDPENKVCITRILEDRERTMCNELLPHLKSKLESMATNIIYDYGYSKNKSRDIKIIKRSVCHDNDTFNETTGKRISSLKAYMAYHQKYIREYEQMIDGLKEIEVEIMKQITRHQDKYNNVAESYTRLMNDIDIKED